MSSLDRLQDEVVSGRLAGSTTSRKPSSLKSRKASPKASSKASPKASSKKASPKAAKAARRIGEAWRAFRSQFPQAGRLFSRSSSEVEVHVGKNAAVTLGIQRDLAKVLVRLASKETPAAHQSELNALRGVSASHFVRVWRVSSGRRFFTVPSAADASHADMHLVDRASWALKGYEDAVAQDARVEGLADEEIDVCLADVQRRWLGAKWGKRRVVYLRPERKSVVAPDALPARYLTTGGSTDGIVGGPGDGRFRLPADVSLFLRRGAKLRYDWRLNPRRRRRVKGVLRRKRWVMRVSHGFTSDTASRVMGSLRKGASLVRRQRHWDLLFPRSISFAPSGKILVRRGQRSLEAEAEADILSILRAARPATVLVAGGSASGNIFREHHAILHVVRLIPVRSLPNVYDLDVVIMDPHAQVTVSATSEARMARHYVEVVGSSGMKLPPLTRRVRQRLALGALGPVVIRDVRVRSQAALPVRQLQVQYSYEGSCGPSSVALSLAAARVVSRDPHLEPAALAKAVFGAVNDLDVVIAAQLVHHFA